ncbi:MAG: hypothetical protein AB7N76_21950 [Planctomycetota bacterium]
MRTTALLLTLLLATTSAYAGPQVVERALTELPDALPPDAELIVVSDRPGALRWGTDGWRTPPAALRPSGTTVVAGGAAETPLRGPGPDGRYRATIGPVGAQARSLEMVVRHPNGWSHGPNGGDARVEVRAGAQVRRRPITVGRGPWLGSSGKVDLYEDFQDWEHQDLRALDPADDARALGDGQDASRDLLALYSRIEDGALFLRADLLDLEAQAPHLVVLVDWAPGGQTWLPSYADGRCAEGWEAAIVVAGERAQDIQVWDASWQLQPAARQLHLRRDLDAIELGLNLDALRRAGWDGKAPLRFAAYTQRPGDDRVCDVVGETSLSDGILDTWIRADQRAGTAKYSVILHGNQAVQPKRWLHDLIESHTTKTPNGNPTGYRRALDAHQLLRVPVNIHVSGTLASTLEWGATAFNDRIRGFLDGQPETGQGALIGGVIAEHIMPFFENARSAQGGEGVNAAATRLNDELLDRIYGKHARSVFWIPERVVRGQTLSDVTHDAQGNPTGYRFAVIDQITHLARWFGRADAEGRNGHKLNRINGVGCFLINDGADQWKFANTDGGLWIWTRRELVGRALDADQEQLTLVFDDWEAFSGRSFTSFGVGNDNPDNYETNLRWIANHPWVQTETLETIASWGWRAVERGTHQNLSIQTYEWLDHASEGGYDHWVEGSAQEEDFQAIRLERTPGARIAAPFGAIDAPGGVLADTWASVARSPAGRLRDLAAAIYAVDVFETAWHDEDMNDYGAKTASGDYLYPDTTFDRTSSWALAMQTRVGDAGVVAAAARWSAQPPSGVRVWREDVDHDGEQELLVADSRAFYALEDDGGRVVFAAVRDPQTGAAEPFLGTLLNAPGLETSREHEATQEDQVTRAPSLVDWWAQQGGDRYVNAAYVPEARPRGWKLRSPDGQVEKEVSLDQGRLTVRYRLAPALGTLYVRCGLSPAALDQFLGGARITDSRRSDGALVTSARTGAGRTVEVALLPESGARLIDNADFGGKGARGVAFTYQAELAGAGDFGFRLEPSLR